MAKAVADPLGGSVIDDSQLGKARGGADAGPDPAVLNQQISNASSSGNVSGNNAWNLTTGSNSISEGTFTNSNGIPTVIQNTGNNVLIQNSTAVTVEFNAK